MTGARRELVLHLTQVADEDFEPVSERIDAQHLFEDLLNDVETAGLLDDPPYLPDIYELTDAEKEALIAFLTVFRKTAERCFEDQTLTLAQVLETTDWLEARAAARFALNVFGGPLAGVTWRSPRQV